MDVVVFEESKKYELKIKLSLFLILVRDLRLARYLAIGETKEAFSSIACVTWCILVFRIFDNNATFVMESATGRL
jgi:hypothetical protein